MEDCKARRERPGGAARPQEFGDAAPSRGDRMSRQRKTAAVLRLLRGEDLETVSRSLGVTAATLTRWRDAFVSAREAALASRPESGEAGLPVGMQLIAAHGEEERLLAAGCAFERVLGTGAERIGRPPLLGGLQ